MASQITSHPAAIHTLVRVPDDTVPNALCARPTGSFRGRWAYPSPGTGQAQRTYTAKSGTSRERPAEASAQIRLAVAGLRPPATVSAALSQAIPGLPGAHGCPSPARLGADGRRSRRQCRESWPPIAESPHWPFFLLRPSHHHQAGRPWGESEKLKLGRESQREVGNPYRESAKPGSKLESAPARL